MENIVAKGEITHFEQYLLLSRSFQKSSVADVSIGWERVKQYWKRKCMRQKAIPNGQTGNLKLNTQIIWPQF